MKVSKEISELLIEKGQEHIIKHLELMKEEEKAVLLQDLEDVDFELLDRLFKTYQNKLFM